VTIHAQILDLMRNLRDETGTAIVLITHDLGVVARCATGWRSCTPARSSSRPT
jgi:ABC-type dipeptide/oligopeptide/nickel transport system ATPase component